jgi:hypothetical protein
VLCVRVRVRIIEHENLLPTDSKSAVTNFIEKGVVNEKY